jgi:hypothetical protein
MDSSDLVKAAVVAAIGTLTKAAVEPALGTGRRVWDWLKAKLTGLDAQVAAAVEAKPEQSGADDQVSALLKKLLNEKPDALDQLRELLGGADGAARILQTTNVLGHGNATAQTAGTGNTVTVSGAPPRRG